MDSQTPQTRDVRALVRQMTLEEAIDWAHVLVLLVDHAPFRQLKPQLHGRQLLVDTRGIWEGKTQ